MNGINNIAAMNGLLIIIFSLVASDASALQKQQYVIGGWIPGTPDTLRKKWAPIFETYLTETVGVLYNPPVEFKLVPVDYDDEESSSPTLAASGGVDFIYTTPGSLACLESTFGFSPIATQRQLNMGRETGAIGSVIYSLMSNDHIHNFSDFVGTRIGVGQPLGVGTFQLGYELLMKFNINIWRDPSQIIFYHGDYDRQMQDIQRENIDVAFVSSGWLEANHPDEMSQFRFFNIKQQEYESEQYPFLSSTRLVPQFGLSAAPGIPWQLRQQVMSALSQLNATNPLAIAAGISTFTSPASYVSARTLAEDLGIMYTTKSGRQCHSQFQMPYLFVKCPALYVKDPPLSAENACGEALLDCPKGLRCLCRPCIPDLPIEMFPSQVVLGLCCTLFSVGLLFSVGWRIQLEGWDLVRRLSSYDPVAKFSKGDKVCTDISVGDEKVAV